MFEKMERLVRYEQDGGTGGQATLLTDNQPVATQPEANPQQPTKTPEPAANNPPEGGKEPSPEAGWVSALEAGLRTNPLLKGHQKPSSFVKEAIGWKEKLDRAVVRPGEGASDAEVAAYRTAMGIPAKPEEYELDGKGFSDQFVKEQRELFHRSGMTKDQAKSLWEATKKQMESGVEALRRANVQERQAAEKTLVAEFGDKFPVKVQAARLALKRFATPALEQYLTTSGLGNNAELIKMLARVQEQIGGDSLLKGLDGTKRNEIPEAQRRFPNSPEMIRK